MRLAGKVALITGAGSGIGEATARRFAREGAKVALMGRRADLIGRVASEVGGIASPGDVAKPADAARAVELAIETYGGLDIVIAAAGIGIGGFAGDVTDEAWQQTLETNLTGPMTVVRAALPTFVKRGGGSIVLISSTNGLAAAPGLVAYDTSKAGLLALSRSIAVDYGARGVRSNVVCPGWVRTPMGDGAMDDIAAAKGVSRQQAYDLVTKHVPLRRAATPEEIASCCLFLASDEASIVTGAVLVADGGGAAVELTSTAFHDETR